MNWIGILLTLSLSKAMAASVTAQVSNLGDTTHLEFAGLNHWDYDLQKKTAQGKAFVELIIPALKEDSANHLEAFKNSDIHGIKISNHGPDGKTIITINLAKANFEAFDYLTDQPSRLVVDIYPGKNSAEPKVTKVKKAESKKSLPEKGERAPATTDILQIAKDSNLEATEVVSGIEKRAGIFDGADPNFDRFNIKEYEVKEDAIIASRENTYLPFPLLRMPILDLEEINTHKPIYEISPRESDENKQARLLLTLYSNKRYNVYLKTVEWFTEKYPKSEYDEIIRFMTADTHFNLWLTKKDPADFDLAMLRYRQALEKYPKSELVERTLLLTGYATLDRGDYLGTLRMFQNQLRTRPESPFRDRARLGVAEAYLKLNRTEEALEQYREIEKSAASERAQIEAAYRAGDVYFQKKDFAGAIQEYMRVQKKYPQSVGDYPSAQFNLSGSLFLLKDYKKSLDSYRDFLKKFPSHEYAGYAMTRVGELLEILGADPSKVVGAYLETYFRYGDAPSAIVARLHLLSSRMKGMKPREVASAVSEIQGLAKKSSLPSIEQFATVMIAEGYNRRQDYDEALSLLIKFYQDHPNSADTVLLNRHINKNINDKIYVLADKGNFIEALKTHNQYADNWLRTSSRIDTKYFVAQSFEQAGVPSQAELIYKNALNKIYSLKGTPEGRERAVIERLPTEDELNLRLAKVSFQQAHLKNSYDYLHAIKNPEKLSEQKQIERVELAAALLDKRGETESAIRYLVDLIKTWKGSPELVAEPYMNLADMEMKENKLQDASKSLERIDQLMADSGKVSEDTHAKALEKLGLIQLSKKDNDAAAKTFAHLLDSYEQKKPLSSIRFKMGEIYFKRGDVQKASDIWKELRGKDGEIWAKIAQETLKNSEWQDGYKKYIKRIPAMSSEPDKGK